ncbi:MAG: hypothetical protein JW703_00755 [Candidatus Diapherotrites archaeon]|nr:hypothetical protein [Candidatus Diapherotrites archaeon]
MKQCNSINSAGERCKNKKVFGSNYCLFHQDRAIKLSFFIAFISLILGPLWFPLHSTLGIYKTIMFNQPVETIAPEINLNLANGSKFFYGDLNELNINFSDKSSIDFNSIILEFYQNNKNIKISNLIPKKNDLTLTLNPNKQ